MLASLLFQIATQYLMYGSCFLSGIGIIGNGLNIFVLVKLQLFRVNRCVLYLIIESTSNLIYETWTLIVTVVPLVYGDSALSQSLFWCRTRFIVFQAASLITSSTICLAACDQFCSTNYRLHLRQTCTMSLARYLICIIVSLSILHSAIFSSFGNIHPLLGCIITNPVWIQYTTYFFYPVLAGFLPILIASSFSLLAYRNVRRVIRRQIPIERRRLDHQVTAMVLARVVLYVNLALLFTCYRVYTINVSTNQVDLLRSAIERLIQSIFYSFNNLNYAVSTSFFRSYNSLFSLVELLLIFDRIISVSPPSEICAEEEMLARHPNVLLSRREYSASRKYCLFRRYHRLGMKVTIAHDRHQPFHFERIDRTSNRRVYDQNIRLWRNKRPR